MDVLTGLVEDGVAQDRSFLNNHILPECGDKGISALQPRPVELWLRELPRSPKFARALTRAWACGVCADAVR